MEDISGEKGPIREEPDKLVKVVQEDKQAGEEKEDKKRVKNLRGLQEIIPVGGGRNRIGEVRHSPEKGVGNRISSQRKSTSKSSFVSTREKISGTED